MKVLIMQFSPISCHFLSLRSKYSPQHPVLKHPQSMITHICSQFLYIHIYSFGNIPSINVAIFWNVTTKLSDHWLWNILDTSDNGREVRTRFCRNSVAAVNNNFMAVAEEISKYSYKPDLLWVQEVRWDRGGSQPAGEYTFFYGKGNENHK
jgi:hypothetical protein